MEFSLRKNVSGGGGEGVLQKESPTLNKKAHVWRWKRGSFSCKHIKMTTVFCGHRSLEHTVPFVVRADVTLALPIPVTVTLFTTQQTGRQREVHHSEHLCGCKFHVWCLCVYICMFHPDITVLCWLGVKHQVTYCMYVFFYVFVGILWIDLGKGVYKSKHVLVWKPLPQIFAYLGDFSRPALSAWLIPTSSHIYIWGVFTFEMCICLWWNLVDLRWPCVVDRTLKSSYYFY